MQLPPVPQTGRQPALPRGRALNKLLQQRHAQDERDPFASDPHPDIRTLGRVALRRAESGDYLTLGDLCAAQSLAQTPDDQNPRLLIFYAGKALMAYERARAMASNDVERKIAAAAAVRYTDWLAEIAALAPTRRNLAVALWALAGSDDDDLPPLTRTDEQAEREARIYALLDLYANRGALPSSIRTPESNERITPTYISGTRLDPDAGTIPLPDSGDPYLTESRTLYNEGSPPSEIWLTDADLSMGGSFSESSDSVADVPFPGDEPSAGGHGFPTEERTAFDAGQPPAAGDEGTPGSHRQRLIDEIPQTPPSFNRPPQGDTPLSESTLRESLRRLLQAIEEQSSISHFSEEELLSERRSLAPDARRVSTDTEQRTALLDRVHLPEGASAAQQLEQDMSAGLSQSGHGSAPSLLTHAPEHAAAIQGEFEPGQIIEGRFEVADVRRGGMGVVYLCYDRHTKEPVALKSFQSRFLENQRAVARFVQEAVTWIRLEKHRHIVQARIVMTMAGRPHIVLEHISGPEGLDADLRSWIEHKRLTLPQAVKFGLHIALGMQHATQRVPGLVHRDLKPANILVTHDGIAKVTDFGLVRSLDEDAVLPLSEDGGDVNERLTRVGAIIGTAPYMSPEQCLSQNVDVRSDIYAFGCLLYEMLTGQHVFKVRKFEAWMHAHQHEQPAFESAVERMLPPQLVRLVLRCLEKHPDERPTAWSEIVEEMAAVYIDLTGQPAELEITGQELEARELMDKGYSLTELGRYEEALAAYDRAIALRPDYDWAWARKGRTLRLLGRYDEALASYNEALRIQPQYAWAWKGKGMVLERIGDLQGALACYRTATEIDPRDVWNWYNQADVLLAMGQLDEALTRLQQAIAVDPQHPNSWAKLGQVYRQQEQYEDAAEAYHRAVELDGTYAWAYNGYGLAMKALGRLKEAVLSFRRATRYQPEEFWHWYNLTEILIDLGLHEEAVLPAEQAVRLQPQYAFAWSKLGQVYRHEKRFEDALAAYDRSLALQPDNAWALNGRGIVLENMGRMEEALAAFKQAAEHSSGDVWTWYNLGNVLSLLGRYDEALAALRRVIELQPAHTRGWSRMGHVLRQMGRYQEAIAALQKALEHDREYAWAWSELGAIYEAQGRADDALDAYSRAASSAPDEAFYAYHRADVLMSLDRLDEARMLLEEALRQDGRNPRTWAKYGQVLRRMEWHDSALNAYNRAVELDSGYAWAWNGRGMVLMALNRHDEALHSFRRATELDPSDAWYWHHLADALITLERFDEAVSALEIGLKINGRQVELWGKLGDAHRRAGRLNDALSIYDRALALDDSYAWAWYGRAVTLEALDRREEALASYERAVEKNDGIIWYYANQVDLLLELRKPKDALRVINRAVERLPDNVIAWARRGQVQRRLNDYAGAVRSYERALELDPAYAWAWNGLGLAYAALNRMDEALDAYAQAVHYNPHDVWFWHNYGDAWLAVSNCPRAVEALERALALDPQHEPSRRKLQTARQCLEDEG